MPNKAVKEIQIIFRNGKICWDLLHFVLWLQLCCQTKIVYERVTNIYKKEKRAKVRVQNQQGSLMNLTEAKQPWPRTLTCSVGTVTAVLSATSRASKNMITVNISVKLKRNYLLLTWDSIIRSKSLLSTLPNILLHPPPLYHALPPYASKLIYTNMLVACRYRLHLTFFLYEVHERKLLLIPSI